MPVIVTRPPQEAAQWVELLRARGVDAHALPLIAIAPAADAAALRQAWTALARHQAVMFVSGNAVREFFRVRPEGSAFARCAWAPGPGTRDALVDAGVDPEAIIAPPADAPQFDSEALWAQVQGRLDPGASVLIVRGGGGRDWLARQLAAAGVQVETLTAYSRELPVWNAQQAGLARRAAAGSTWLFSSSEAIANLARLMPGQAWSGACAVATHPRIAEAARGAGLGRVLETRPPFEAVIAALESAR
jgi:uroporphyrinogen-III synthase